MATWKKDQVINTRVPAVHAAAGKESNPAFVTRQRIADVYGHLAVSVNDVIGASYLYHLPTGYQLGSGLSEIEAHTVVRCLYELPLDWGESLPLLGATEDVLAEVRELTGLNIQEACLGRGCGGLAIFGAPELPFKWPSDYIIEQIEAEEAAAKAKPKKRLASVR